MSLLLNITVKYVSSFSKGGVGWVTRGKDPENINNNEQTRRFT